MKWALVAWLAMGMTAGWAFGDSTTRPADAADVLAQAILQKANIHATVCEMPRVGDGVLAAALARQQVEHVQGLAPTAALAAQAARMPATEANVIGSQVIIETGSPSAIPMGDWVADLMVVADATDANLPEIPPAEVKRVLSPYRGVAIVGQAKNGGGGLTVAGLTAWANRLGGTADVKQDDTGLWAVIKMPALAGGDDWSHYYHGPDGNPVSQDTVISGPQFGLQWMGGPYWSGKFDVHVAAGGREFHAQSTIYWRNTNKLPFVLRARSLYNGQVLWEHKIAPNFGDIGSLLIATTDRLYVKDGGSAEALNAETGEELLRFGDKDKDECRWIELSDGVLVTMVGPKRDKEWVLGQWNTGQSNEQQQGYENSTFVATEIDGWDAAGGKQLWQFKENKIDPAKTVIRDGRVYTYANLAYAAALDLKTGKLIWKTPAPIEDPAGPYAALPWVLNSIMTPRQCAIATKDVYLINSKAHMQCAAFAAADGKLLWQKETGKGKTHQQTQEIANQMLNYPVAIGGMFYDGNAQWVGWDPLTGKPTQQGLKISYAGCGHFTATESGLIFGQCGGVFDMPNNQSEVLDAYTKAACGVSQFAADGTVVKAPADCPGCTEWMGFLVTHNRAPASAAAADQAPRLEQGPGYDAPAAQPPCDDRDWPTYRSTNARCASSAAMLPDEVTLRWTYTPAPSTLKTDPVASQYGVLPRTEPSPAIAVGSRIFFGNADGAVICLDSASGKEIWRYWTGGQVTSSPTWYQGRVYAGSADGWVYCLSAESGELAWRYRLAPRDARIMVFGRLSSPWPILANVLVQDGVAYAAGGLVGTLDGTVLMALDARTGQLKWSQQWAADAENDKSGFFPPSADGQLAWDNGRIWWHVADSGIRVVDAATGQMKPAPDLFGMGVKPWVVRDISRGTFLHARGQDIGVMPGGWIVIGGLHYFLPGECWGQQRNTCQFIQADGTGNATAEILQLDKAHMKDYLPAWNGQDVLMGGSGQASMKDPAVRPMVWHGLAASLSAEAKAHPIAMGATTSNNISLLRESKVLPAPDQIQPVLSDSLIKQGTIGWNTPIMAANGAVLLGRQWPNSWIFALGRPDRKELGRVLLPALPVLGAMSLTRDGQVLVPLVNGQLLCLGAPPAK